MAIKAQRSSDAAPRRAYWADREAAAAPRRRNSRDARRRAAPIAVDGDPRARYQLTRDGSSGEVKSPGAPSPRRVPQSPGAPSPRRVPPTPAPTPTASATAVTPRAHRTFFFDAMRHKVSKKKKRTQTSIDSVEFDLDLTDVTPRLIAMGFPSTGLEATYRNSATELRDYIDRKHGGLKNVKLYNLCAERSYPVELFEGKFSRFPFRDHQPPPLGMFAFFCSDVDEFLKKSPHNVAMVHCIASASESHASRRWRLAVATVAPSTRHAVFVSRQAVDASRATRRLTVRHTGKAGKGRTGVMLAAYLVWSGVSADARDALTFYAGKRTNNRKGVTIPSQRRFVDYFCRLLRVAAREDSGDSRDDYLGESKSADLLPRAPTDPRPPRLYSEPDDDDTVASEAFLDDSWNAQNRRAQMARGGLPRKKWLSVAEVRVTECPRDVKTVRIRSGASVFEASLTRDGSQAIARFEVAVPRQKTRDAPRFGRCRVADEVEVVFYKRASSFSCASRPKRAFACWFHTHFVENGALTLAKHELDKACKCKKASPDLRVSIKFRPPPRSKRAPSPNNVVP